MTEQTTINPDKVRALEMLQEATLAIQGKEDGPVAFRRYWAVSGCGSSKKYPFGLVYLAF